MIPSVLSARERAWHEFLHEQGSPISATVGELQRRAFVFAWDARVSALEAESNTTRLQEMLDQQTEYSIRLQRKLESLGIEPWGDFHPSTSSVVGYPEQETKA